jgi:TolB-like protein
MTQKENVPLKILSEQIQNLGVKKIERQLQRILDSPEFNAAKQQRKFFQFVVKETLAGRSQEIKGYTIATCVFGRREDFDQNSDPIVSVQANRLRRALERYYLVAGKQDPILIDIPKGTYIPTFCEQVSVTSDTTVFDNKIPVESFMGSWPTLLIRPFKNLTADPEMNYWAVGLATELATEITRYQEIRVLIQGPEGIGKRASDMVARFVVDGNVQKDMSEIKVAVYLIDTSTNIKIWGESHQAKLEAARLISFQEKVAKAIAGKISCEDGIISKTLSVESRNKPPFDLKTYEAMLRYYEYDQALTPESFLLAMEALTIAADMEPECGQVLSMLGRLHANIYSLELPGYEATSIRKAVGFAEKGVLLNPDNQRARAILGFVRMLDNEIPGALAETELALNLNPNSLFILDGIGYLMTLLGEWERGPALIRKAMKLNPYYKPVVHYALWVDYLRQEEYQQAHFETQRLRRPSIFWDPLAKAATLGILGKYEEGKHFVKNLLELKPDFSERGRILIKHYIKFEDIVERVIDGLQKVGLNIV